MPRKKDYKRAELMLKLYTEQNMTLAEIGAIYTITRERVRQILAEQDGYVSRGPGPRRLADR